MSLGMLCFSESFQNWIIILRIKNAHVHRNSHYCNIIRSVVNPGIVIWGKELNFSEFHFTYVWGIRNLYLVQLVFLKNEMVWYRLKNKCKKKKRRLFPHSWKDKQGRSHCPESLKFIKGIERSPPWSSPK